MKLAVPAGAAYKDGHEGLYSDPRFFDVVGRTCYSNGLPPDSVMRPSAAELAYVDLGVSLSSASPAMQPCSLFAHHLSWMLCSMQRSAAARQTARQPAQKVQHVRVPPLHTQIAVSRIPSAQPSADGSMQDELWGVPCRSLIAHMKPQLSDILSCGHAGQRMRCPMLYVKSCVRRCTGLC